MGTASVAVVVSPLWALHGSRGSVVGLTQLNVWLDAVFLTLYPIIVFALTCHFIGNILTGRAKQRFGKEWKWPHHDSHPPLLPKIMHFQHVACMFILGASGLLIRFNPESRGALQWIHYVAMLIVTFNLFWRLWYAFASRQRDYKEFALTKNDITTVLMVVGYYIFLVPPEKKPHFSKYNVMQKTVYILFAPMLLIQAITGFMLWRLQLPLVDVSLQALTAGLIGATGVWWMRTIHYIMNWLFIVFTTIHVYLSLSEDFPAFLIFFGLGGLDKHGDGGHGHDEEPAPAYAAAEHA